MEKNMEDSVLTNSNLYLSGFLRMRGNCTSGEHIEDPGFNVRGL